MGLPETLDKHLLCCIAFTAVTPFPLDVCPQVISSILCSLPPTLRDRQTVQRTPDDPSPHSHV